MGHRLYWFDKRRKGLLIVFLEKCGLCRVSRAPLALYSRQPLRVGIRVPLILT